MPSDASIYSLLRPPQPAPNPMEQYGQVLQMKNLIGRGKLQDQAIVNAPQIESDRQRQVEGNLTKQDAELVDRFSKEAIREMKSIRTQEEWTAFRNLEMQRMELLSTPHYQDTAKKSIEQMPEEFDPQWIKKKITESEKSTQFMRNQQAAGRGPGTPEFAEDWEEYKKRGQSGRGEYFVPVQTAEGVKAFDARRGTITEPQIGGEPVIGSVSDPALQGRISGAKKFASEVGKETADIGRGRDSLTSVSEGRAMLDKGIYTGLYANALKTVAKAIPGVNKDKAANTELFLSHIGNIVIPRLKDFGGNDTVEEMRYLQQVMGGNIQMEEKALRGVLDSVEQKLNAKIQRLSGQAQSVGLGDQAAMGGPTPAPVKAASPSREEIDAELRRRGVIR